MESQNPQGTKILIVDDSDTVRSDLKEVLLQAGYHVVEGVDGADGLEKAKSNSDLAMIIADVNMPKMNGIEMCTKIREVTNHKTTTIIMLTTERNDEAKEQARACGVSVWIVKPFKADKMIAGISKLISKQKAAAA